MLRSLAGGLGWILPRFRLPVRIVAVLALVSMAVLALGSPEAYAKPVAASIIVDAETGEVLSRSNADTLTYPASLTKMMTLYMLFDAIDSGKVSLTDKITFSANAAGEPATNLNAKPGYTIQVETAILALVIRSANDVATAVGEHLGGSEKEFARMMTAKARALGMKNTTFRNAHGLPNADQRTTARDMAVLGVALLRDHPDYYDYFSRSKFSYRGVSYATHNRVLRKFTGADGMKTGYIRASGFNLVTSAHRDGRRLVGVVLGGSSAASRDKHMIDLMAKAFKIQQGTGDVLVAKAPGSAGPAKAIAVAAAAPAAQPATYDDSVAVAALAPVVKPATQEELDDLDTATTLAAMTSVSLASAQAKPDDQAVANVWDGQDRFYGVQVGAYSKYNPAQKAAQKATATVPNLLADARIVIDQSKTGNGGSLYRARVFGLTKDAAEDACVALKKKRTDCLVIQGDSNVAQTAQ
ncbi:D-alanyl-D-alanine carboxypeptidase family protein [Dongia sp.]|uniref:D-alanyl-D-alanine carboxypeptidase family protein n=1 Tax=Dongia sp. TaxID=1977262 RepID=UPI0035AF5416